MTAVPLVDRLVRMARSRSPWLFHLNAGSCNGCDIELVACPHSAL